jgi:hypothetical protein
VILLKARISRLVVGVFWVVLMLALLQCPVYAASQTASTLSLTITDVSATGITQTSATISWQTSINATSQVFYDTEFHEHIGDYAHHTAEDMSFVLEHDVSLSGLDLRTRYPHFRVKSTTDSTEAISDDHTFSTRTRSGGGGTSSHDELDMIIYMNGGVSEWPINSSGDLLEAVDVTSTAGEISIHIPRDTLCLDAEDERLDE